MATESAALAPHPPHGPVASAVKWTFKSYLRARRAVAEAVAEARAEPGTAGPETPRTVAGAIAGGAEEGTESDPVAVLDTPRPVDRLQVRWLSADGVEERPVDDLQALLDRKDGFVWVDIPEFDEPAERLLSKVFAFHPLAIRDCREPGHVPKVHAYDDHLFIVLHAPEREAGGEVHHRELNQFIGERYLVTVHERLGGEPVDGGLPETVAVLDRIEAGRARPVTPAELSYAIVTRLSVRMEAMVAELASAVAALASAVSSQERHLLRRPQGSTESVVDEMFELRHALLAIETIADQNRVVCARTAAVSQRLVTRDGRKFIDDVEDQFSRIRRLCRAQKELLQGVLDFSRTRTSAKMDLAMSRLALLSAVAMPISIISSIYGMQLWVFPATRLDILAALLVLMGALTYAMMRWAKAQGWW